MDFSLEDLSSTIVVIGSFNPPIFTPEWLEKHNLIGSDDVKSAQEHASLVLTADISRFETEKFALQIVKNQCVIGTKGPVTPALLDLVVGIFGLVQQTPVTAVGLNYLAEYKFFEPAKYHKIGDTLAPKNIWEKLLPESGNCSVGLSSLAVQIDPYKRGEKPSENTLGQSKTITISPTLDKNYFIKMSLNDHYPIIVPKASRESATTILIDILKTQWESSLKFATDNFELVLSTAIHQN